MGKIIWTFQKLSKHLLTMDQHDLDRCKKTSLSHMEFKPKLEPSIYIYIYMKCPYKPATNIRICKEAKNKQKPFVNYLHLMFPSCWMNWFPTSFSPLLLVSSFQQAERTRSATLAVAAQAVCGSGDVKTVRDVCWRWIDKRVRRPWCKEIFLGSTRHQDLKYMKDLQFSKEETFEPACVNNTSKNFQWLSS